MAEDPLPPDCRKKFRYVRPIAAGGFGAVHEAVHRELERPVAVKLLLSSALGDPAQRGRFEKEARVTAAISDPHVIEILDSGAGSGTPWIAFELVPGRSLREILDASPGGLPLRDVISITCQVAEALGAAHARGVIHRDIKPGNVLDFGAGHYKVTDFGIAKWSESATIHTRDGFLLGTPSYIAPELIRGEPASPASDVYATGILFHELLTGSPPFTGKDPLAILEQHLKSPVPPVGAQRPGLPRALDGILASMLAKDPGDRPAGARGVREALQPLLEREAAGARSRQATSAFRSIAAPERVSDTALMTPRPPVRRPFVAAVVVIAVALAAGGISWVRLASHNPAPPTATVAPRISLRAEIARFGEPEGSGTMQDVERILTRITEESPEALKALWRTTDEGPGVAKLIDRIRGKSFTSAQLDRMEALFNELRRDSIPEGEPPLARATQAAWRISRMKEKPGSDLSRKTALTSLLVAFYECSRSGDAVTFAQGVESHVDANLAESPYITDPGEAAVHRRLDRLFLLLARRAVRVRHGKGTSLERDLDEKLGRIQVGPPVPASPRLEPVGKLILAPELVELAGSPAKEFLLELVEADTTRVVEMARTGRLADSVGSVAIFAERSPQLWQSTWRAVARWLDFHREAAGEYTSYWLARAWAHGWLAPRGSVRQATISRDWLLYAAERAVLELPDELDGKGWTLEADRQLSMLCRILMGVVNEWTVAHSDRPDFAREASAREFIDAEPVLRVVLVRKLIVVNLHSVCRWLITDPEVLRVKSSDRSGFLLPRELNELSEVAVMARLPLPLLQAALLEVEGLGRGHDELDLQRLTDAASRLHNAIARPPDR